MQTTLILENGTQLTATIGVEKGFELLHNFVGLISGRTVVAQPEPKINPPQSIPDTHKVPPRQVQQERVSYKLVAFNCPECESITVIKMPSETDIGDVVACRCGNEMQIKTLKPAAGECPNCSEKFYRVYIANDAKEIRCKNCKGLIDLTELPDGTITTARN